MTGAAGTTYGVCGLWGGWAAGRVTSRIRLGLGSVFGRRVVEQAEAVRDEELHQDDKLQLVAARVAVRLPPKVQREEEQADQLTEHELRQQTRRRRAHALWEG